MLAPSYLPESKQLLATELVDGLESNALSWLSGYFAGVAQGRQLTARPVAAPVAAPAVAAVAGTRPATQLTILYGNQTGSQNRVATPLEERAGATDPNIPMIRPQIT